MDSEEIGSVADLVQWLEIKLSWFSNDPGVRDGAWGSSVYGNLYEDALQECLQLGLPDGVEALGPRPPDYSGFGNVNRTTSLLSRRCLERLLKHLQGPDEVEYPNGPDGSIVGRFYWKNVVYALTPRQWDCCKVLWGRDEVGFDELYSQVWGEEYSDNKKSTVKSAVSKLNTELNESGIPIEWTGSREVYRLVAISN